MGSRRATTCPVARGKDGIGVVSFSRRWARRRRGDDGFALVEMMVALVVFGLVAAAVLMTLNAALGMSRTNRQRVVAAGLAARQIEIARGMSAATIPDGQQVWSVPVDATTYTLTQTAQYVQDQASGSPCTSGSNGAPGYKRISVVVTWPAMLSVRPVRSDTLKKLGFNALGPGTGILAVPVVGAAGGPLAGATVTVLTGSTWSSQVAGADGCAVFTGLVQGTYTVTVSNSAGGYVDVNGNTFATLAGVSVAAGQFTKAPNIPYDQAATISASYTTPAGYVTPTAPGAFGLTLVNPGLTGGKNVRRTCLAPGGASGSCSTAGLFPFPSGYVAWAGDCLDSVSSPAPAAVQVAPGQAATGTVGVGTFQLSSRASGGAQQPSSKAMNAVHLGDASCAPEYYSLGTTSTTAPLLRALPYGTWTLATNTTGGGAPSTGWTTMTLAPGQAPQVVVAWSG